MFPEDQDLIAWKHQQTTVYAIKDTTKVRELLQSHTTLGLREGVRICHHLISIVRELRLNCSRHIGLFAPSLRLTVKALTQYW